MHLEICASPTLYQAQTAVMEKSNSKNETRNNKIIRLGRYLFKEYSNVKYIFVNIESLVNLQEYKTFHQSK